MSKNRQYRLRPTTYSVFGLRFRIVRPGSLLMRFPFAYARADWIVRGWGQQKAPARGRRGFAFYRPKKVRCVEDACWRRLGKEAPRGFAFFRLRKLSMICPELVKDARRKRTTPATSQGFISPVSTIRSLSRSRRNVKEYQGRMLAV